MDSSGPVRPVYAHPPGKVETYTPRRVLTLDLLENLYFALATGFSLVFAVLLLRQGVTRWSSVAYLIVFWAVLAYLALPRVHRILSAIYVPGYFIGRSRTSDGLLGDPINLALVGSAAQVHAAMRRAGWVRADPVDMRSSVRIVRDSLARRSYPEAPVSPLLLFGRIQEFAYQQEVEGNPAQRHHVRFWPTPPGWLLPGGHRVDWLAAGTYDRAVGLSLFTLQITHKVDRDIDIERDYLIASVRYAVPQARVDLIKDFATGYHTRNGGGDAVQTDGDLPILDVTAVDPGAAGPGTAAVDTPAGGEDLLHQVGRRPFAIVAAVALTTVSLLVSLVAGLREVATTDWVADLGGADPGVAPVILLGVIAATYGVSAVLVWLTYRGSQAARLCMLAALTFSLVNQTIGLGTARPTFWTLAGMSLDLLTVYALTTLSARTWTARGHRARQG